MTSDEKRKLFRAFSDIEHYAVVSRDVDIFNIFLNVIDWVMESGLKEEYQDYVIKSALQPEDEWIDASIEVPSKSGLYLCQLEVFSKNKLISVEPLTYENEWFNIYGEKVENKMAKVTYWRYLPNPV